MTTRPTDAERAAQLRARADALDAKESEKAARKASKEVRALERDIAVMERLMQHGTPSVDTLKETHDELQALLKMARASALPRSERAQ